MFRGDSNFDDLEASGEFSGASKLGMEARSILKSIRTEESKLLHSQNLTRSDRHYFRARADYYRLSLKRLPPEEKFYLEPVLARFNERIIKLELEDGVVVPTKPIPFLAPVERSFENESDESISELPEIKSSGSLSSQTIHEMVSQLSLVQLALSADINADSRRILADGLERVIQRLKSLS